MHLKPFYYIVILIMEFGCFIGKVYSHALFNALSASRFPYFGTARPYDFAILFYGVAAKPLFLLVENPQIFIVRRRPCLCESLGFPHFNEASVRNFSLSDLSNYQKIILMNDFGIREYCIIFHRVSSNRGIAA